MENADSKSQNGIKGSGKTKCIDKVMEKVRGQSSVSLIGTLKFLATIHLRYSILCLLNVNKFLLSCMWITWRKKLKCVYSLFIFQNCNFAEKHFSGWKFQDCNKIRSHRLEISVIGKGASSSVKLSQWFPILFNYGVSKKNIRWFSA